MFLNKNNFLFFRKPLKHRKNPCNFLGFFSVLCLYFFMYVSFSLSLSLSLVPSKLSAFSGIKTVYIQYYAISKSSLSSNLSNYLSIYHSRYLSLLHFVCLSVSRLSVCSGIKTEYRVMSLQTDPFYLSICLSIFLAL